MNAEQFISIVRNRLGKRFHEEVLRYAIGRAFAMFMNEQPDLTPYRKDYFDQDVLVDGSRYYSLLPATPLNIGDSIRINTTEGNEITFERSADGQSEVFSNLEVSIISNVIPFKLRTDRVVYQGIGQEIKKVDISIVIPFEEYDFTDEFYLPEGADELIIETTTNFLIGTPPIDNLND